MRKLSSLEEQNTALLTAKSVNFTLIEPTETALKKSILDATAPVRNYLLDKNIHDYSHQNQGPEAKIIVTAQLLTPSRIIQSSASLYRPNTKKGDPRIWFRKLGEIAKPNDILAIIARDDQLFAFNISQIKLQTIYTDIKNSPIRELIDEINKSENNTAQELLGKLKNIAARGFIPAEIDKKADTAIGRTLETLLGIDINSAKAPDYKGIELKSYRTSPKGRENRKTLFAQVPNWKLSKFKSSREILDNFGYARDDDYKLYCTISTQLRNSQGLKFRMDSDDHHLIENSDRNEIGDFAVWAMADLRQRLLEKHNETFWVAANTMMKGEHEHFQFTKVLHTRKPILSQFDLLIDQGSITMDHLIKRNPQGKVSEKGPLFKIRSDALEQLFPPSQEYFLCKAA